MLYKFITFLSKVINIRLYTSIWHLFHVCSSSFDDFAPPYSSPIFSIQTSYNSTFSFKKACRISLSLVLSNITSFTKAIGSWIRRSSSYMGLASGCLMCSSFTVTLSNGKMPLHWLFVSSRNASLTLTFITCFWRISPMFVFFVAIPLFNRLCTTRHSATNVQNLLLFQSANLLSKVSLLSIVFVL